MGDVVNLDEMRPYIHGDASCANCDHEWQACVEIEASYFVQCSLKCPNCKHIKGYFKYPHGPSVTKSGVFYQCACSGDHFYILDYGKRKQCIRCGKVTDIEV